MRKIFSITLFALLVTNVASADNWPQWRGPQFNGAAADGEYPVKWSSTENVAWRYKLPGRSGSTPAVWGDHIFVTCDGEKQNQILCLNRKGERLWQTEIGTLRKGKHRKAAGSNPSPTTDGKHVFVYFKSGDLACLDFAGTVVWQKNMQVLFGEDSLWWDLGSSPVLTKDTIVITCMQTGPSYLAAFDKATGELKWKQDRMLDAPVEAAQSYTTPVVYNDGDQQIIVVLGADHVTAHDGATGKELWRLGGLNPAGDEYYRSIASAVVADGIVVAPYARGTSITAIRLGGKGDVTDSHKAWEKFGQGISPDVPTPAAADGKVYLCSDKGNVVCFDITTGKKIWGGQVEKNRNAYSSSPIIAGGHVYITREDGKTFVLAQGDEFKQVAANTLKETTVATPVFVDGNILLQTHEHLYCIGSNSR